MTMIIRDRTIAEVVRRRRARMDGSRFDEVWDGVYVIPPVRDLEHQWLLTEISCVIWEVLDPGARGRVYPGVNVSDRFEGWLLNYRIPDVAVVLAGSAVRNCGTHWCGGPDLVIEIVSADDLTREKRPFYGKIGVRELWVLDRDPWALELYRLDGGDLRLVAIATPDDAGLWLESVVVPLSLRLVPGPDRPEVEMRTADGGRTWRA